MTDHIRELLELGATRKEIEVEYEGRTFLVAGEPDANLLTDTVFLDDAKLKQKAAHFSKLLLKKIDPTVVRNCIIVHATLQVPEGADPYSLGQIIKLSTMQAGLMMKLTQAGMDVLGLAGLADKDPVADVAVGNSEEAEL